MNTQEAKVVTDSMGNKSWYLGDKLQRLIDAHELVVTSYQTNRRYLLGGTNTTENLRKINQSREDELRFVKEIGKLQSELNELISNSVNTTQNFSEGNQ